MTVIAKLSPGGFDRRDANRSAWLLEALAQEAPASPVEPLRDGLSVDVCVVGGGYTGLWTALNIKRLSPTTSVAVLEADICGAGASGRNGGFVMTWWSKFATLTKLCGSEAALDLAYRSEENVAAIGAFCRENGVPGFHQGGWLWAATNVAQVDSWKHTLDMVAAVGANPYELLSREEVTARSGSPVHLAGIYEGKAGVVQPAALARGLASAARRLGVQIFERSPMTELLGLRTPVVRTPGGDVTAHRVVLAINAWGAALPQLRRSLVVIASDVVCTEPVPDRLQEIGWGPELTISDSRRLVNYYRVTEDGRIVFGKGGGTLALGGRVGASYNRASDRIDEVQNQLRHIYPALWDVGIAASWRGPIDYSLTGLPFFCQIAGRDDIVAGVGFSGNGVGPSYMAGKTLAKLVLEGRDESMPEALTAAPAGRLPREPLRYLGGLAVRAATARKEANEDLGRRTGPIASTLARLDPTSFVDRGSGRDGVDGAVAGNGSRPSYLSLRRRSHNGIAATTEQTGEEDGAARSKRPVL